MEAYKTLKARNESGETSSLTKDSAKWMSFVPGGRNSGIGPTGASHVPMSEGRAHWHPFRVGKTGPV